MTIDALLAELNPKQRIAASIAEQHAKGVADRKVHTPVDSGDGGFGRSLIEGLELARLLRRDQTMVNVCDVSQSLDAEHVGENVRCRARLHGVSGGVARKVRRHDVWHP